MAPGASNDADIPAGAVPFEPTIGAFGVNIAGGAGSFTYVRGRIEESYGFHSHDWPSTKPLEGATA